MDNAICAGHTGGSLGGEANAGGTDVFAIKLDATGALSLQAQLGAVTAAPGGDNSMDGKCLGVALDLEGNIVCAGSTNGSLGEENNNGSTDIIVLKLDAEGKLIIK